MRREILVAAAALLVLTACSDTSERNNGETPPDCPTGQRYNPVTGACELREAPNNEGRDAGGNNDPSDGGQDNNGRIDAGPDGGMDVVDLSEDLRCATGRDDDGDGLENDCECVLATSPARVDTDTDGLSDGEEDANGNCRVDPGVETDPRSRDTDIDGASDGDEIAAGTDPLVQDGDGDGVLDGAELASCSDPMVADTDGDGLPDGVEDANGDGELGTCANRVYEISCAAGESDPCAADTDGDGSPDSDEAQYRTCRPEDLQNLVTPQFLTSAAADYKLALELGLTTAPVTTAGLEAHVFEDTANQYTGFIASLDAAGQTNPSLVADGIVGLVQGAYPAANRRVSGRRITTHDNFKAAVGGIVNLPANTALGDARDTVLARIAGLQPADITHGLTTTLPGDASETLFVFEVVSRSATQYVIAGAFVTLTDYTDDSVATGIRVDDITGGTAIARANEGLVDECVSYLVTTRPQVDIIIALDASGSMTDEQTALANFASTFTTMMNASNVDWRVGVTSVSCSGASQDQGLSADFKALFPTASGFPPSGPCPSIPFSSSGGNGALVGGDFTSDPAVIASRLNAVDGTNSEFSGTMGLAGVDRALPRAAGSPSKIRPDAAIIVIAITDEEDEFFAETLSFLPTSALVLTQTQQTELAMAAQGFVDYALKPDVGATVFGLYWPPGETCGTGATVAHSIAHIVNETGGGGGSVCQPDITNTLAALANASAGIASGLRLRGVPIAPTLRVIHGDASSQTIGPLARSRADGFDYDPIVNRIAFRGPNPPETNDRVVIPYRRWANSVFVCTTTAECPAEQKLKCVDGECR